MAEDIEKLKYRIAYEFKDRALLREALTHRSYAVENDLKYDNQRLEFLGDAVLGVVLTEWLFRSYPKAQEGPLTKIRSSLACQGALAIMARYFSLGDFILLGNGEIESGGADRDSTLADLTESLVGAIYLDSDFGTVKEWLLKYYTERYPDPEKVLRSGNPKGLLQEYTQRKWSQAPEYQIESVDGPDHNPQYKVSVTAHGVKATGEAFNRKNAEVEAARNLLQKLSETDPELDNN